MHVLKHSNTNAYIGHYIRTMLVFKIQIQIRITLADMRTTVRIEKSNKFIYIFHWLIQRQSVLIENRILISIGDMRLSVLIE